jgi:hypothetical protein
MHIYRLLLITRDEGREQDGGRTLRCAALRRYNNFELKLFYPHEKGHCAINVPFHI